MKAHDTRTGRCLCGKVVLRLVGEVHDVTACHCDMCRRWGGGPALGLVGDYNVEIDGEENIVRFRSSEWAERAFCGVCGSNLFYQLVDTDKIGVEAGLLDDQSGLTFTGQIFIDEKPDWYTFANETKKMTGAEVFAMYAPKEGEQG